MNRIILIGRLTKDPELKYLPDGTAVCNFTLAVDRSFKNAQGEKEADFINIVVWRKQGEACANHLSKGKLVAVDGSLRIESWKKDDKWHNRTVVNAENVKFLSPRDPSDAAGGNDFISGEYVPPDDDLPF